MKTALGLLCWGQIVYAYNNQELDCILGGQTLSRSLSYKPLCSALGCLIHSDPEILLICLVYYEVDLVLVLFPFSPAFFPDTVLQTHMWSTRDQVAAILSCFSNLPCVSSSAHSLFAAWKQKQGFTSHLKTQHEHGGGVRKGSSKTLHWQGLGPQSK